MEDKLKKIMQPKTIKSKTNDCGTAPGNLVSLVCQFHQTQSLQIGRIHNNDEGRWQHPELTGQRLTLSDPGGGGVYHTPSGRFFETLFLRLISPFRD